MRLNNYISATTDFVRAAKLINTSIDRRVTVNGELAELGMQIGEEDQVSLDGNLLTPKSEFVTIAYHKPVGIICTSETVSKVTSSMPSDIRRGSFQSVDWTRIRKD